MTTDRISGIHAAIRESVDRIHREGERHRLVGALLGDGVSRECWAELTLGRFLSLNALDLAVSVADSEHVPGSDYNPVLTEDRTARAWEDLRLVAWLGLLREDSLAAMTSVTAPFTTRTAHHLRADHRLLMPHVYARHLGDLYGGRQMAARSPVPDSSASYAFDDPEGFAKGVLSAVMTAASSMERDGLLDVFLEESVLAFRLVIDLYDVVADRHGL
jgi:heme oxygenase